MQTMLDYAEMCMLDTYWRFLVGLKIRGCGLVTEAWH